MRVLQNNDIVWYCYIMIATMSLVVWNPWDMVVFFLWWSQPEGPWLTCPLNANDAKRVRMVRIKNQKLEITSTLWSITCLDNVWSRCNLEFASGILVVSFFAGTWLSAWTYKPSDCDCTGHTVEHPEDSEPEAWGLTNAQTKFVYSYGRSHSDPGW